MSLDRAALARRLLLALGLADVTLACSSPAREPSPPPPAGPATAVPVATAVASSPPVATVATVAPEVIVPVPVETCTPAATSTARGTLPPQPVQGPPRNDHRPTVEDRDVCWPPAATPAPSHFPAPYERCPVDSSSRGQGEATFSRCLTDEARHKQADVCCYHRRIVHNAGRPLRLGGTSVAARLVAQAWG